MVNRRIFLCGAAAGLAQVAEGQPSSVPASIRDLRPMTDGIQPITADERLARIEKARRLMRENKLDAIFLDGGSSLFYFTGVRWAASESTFGLVIPARGLPVWIAPQPDEQRAREAIGAGS